MTRKSRQSLIRRGKAAVAPVKHPRGTFIKILAKEGGNLTGVTFDSVSGEIGLLGPNGVPLALEVQAVGVAATPAGKPLKTLASVPTG